MAYGDEESMRTLPSQSSGTKRNVGSSVSLTTSRSILWRSAIASQYGAIAVREVTTADGTPLTGLDLAEARGHAASVGARLPTEDEWQLAAEAGLLERAEPLVWNWTESEHTDGRTRFVILKGGCGWRAEGSDWYVDGGPQAPAYSLKLLLLGGGMARSTSIGFRLAVDLQ